MGNTDTHCYPNSDRNAYTYSYRNSDCNGYGDRGCSSDCYCYCDSDPYTDIYSTPNPNTKVQPATKASADSAAETLSGLLENRLAIACEYSVVTCHLQATGV